MGFVQPAAVQLLAESTAVTKLSDDAAKALASHLDVRLREVIQEARKFSRHAKSKTLTTEDINNALRLRNCEPLYGFGGKDGRRFARAAGHSDLYYLRDLEVPIKQVVDAQPSGLPLEIGLVPHWLAIDGVQPQVPENTPLERPKAKRPRTDPTNGKVAKRKLEAGPASQASSQKETAVEQQAATVVPPVKQLLSAELQVFLGKVHKVLDAAQAMADDEPGGPFSGWPSMPAEGSGVHTAAPQRLVEERALLASLSSDPGLHPLVVALINLITEQLKKSMKQLPQLHLLIKVARSMLRNKHMHLQLYIHRLVSVLMTCMVSKRLGSSPSEDHWSVRSAAARVLAEICARFQDKYPDLPQRISKQLVKAFTDLSKPLSTHYGAIVGLQQLGPRFVRLLLLPHAQQYSSLLERALEQESRNEVQKAEARQVHAALLQACASSMQASMADRLSKDFFSKLQPLQGLQRGYRNKKGPQQSEATVSNGTQLSEASLASQAMAGSTEKDELEDAWKEDGSIGRHLQAVHELFGDAVQPHLLCVPSVWLF